MSLSACGGGDDDSPSGPPNQGGGGSGSDDSGTTDYISIRALKITWFVSIDEYSNSTESIFLVEN